MPFPSRPRAARTVSSDAASDALARRIAPPVDFGLVSARCDARRPSAVSSASYVSTASSSGSQLFSGTRSRAFSSDLDVDPAMEDKLFGRQPSDRGTDDVERRKRLVEFLDQTAEAMEGGRSLAMVLPQSKASESEPAKSMSELAETCTPATIEYRHPFTATPSETERISESGLLSPRDNTLLQPPAQDTVARSQSPTTPRLHSRRNGAASQGHRHTVYYTPNLDSDGDVDGDDEQEEDVYVEQPVPITLGGGLGFKFDIKTETTLDNSSVDTSVLTPERSPATLRASSPASFAQGSSKRVAESAPALSGPAISSEVAQELERRAKQAEKRRSTIRELIDTEAAYASDMVVVREIYLARARGAGMQDLRRGRSATADQCLCRHGIHCRPSHGIRTWTDPIWNHFSAITGPKSPY